MKITSQMGNLTNQDVIRLWNPPKWQKNAVRPVSVGTRHQWSCRFGQLPNLVLGTGFFPQKIIQHEKLPMGFPRKSGKSWGFSRIHPQKTSKCISKSSSGVKIKNRSKLAVFLVWHSSGHEKHLQLINMMSLKRWVVILRDPNEKVGFLVTNPTSWEIQKVGSSEPNFDPLHWSWPKMDRIVIPKTRYSPVNRHTLGNWSPNMGVTRFPIRQHPKLHFLPKLESEAGWCLL